MRISDWSSDVCSSDLKDFPDAGFLIQDGSYDLLLHSLRAGELDLIVTTARQLHNDDVVEVPLFEDTLAVVARAGHPLVREGVRSEERRVGKGGVSTFRSRWSPTH